jgi:hypothetical protein
MTPVFQRVVDPKTGDCYRAAVATVLDASLDDVPADIGNGFSYERYFHERGIHALHLENHRLRERPEGYTGSEPWDVRKLVRYDYAAGAVAVASVPSQRFPGGWHAIVVQFVVQPEGWVRLECVHDPNPGNAPYDMTQTEVRALTFFLPRGAV